MNYLAKGRKLKVSKRAGISLVSASLASILLISACAQGQNNGSTGQNETPQTQETAAGDVATLRFTWWGGDARHQITQEVIDAFNAEHDDIQVTGEFGDWTGYWDKLATAVAGGNAPDIIQMDEKYLKAYAERGSFYDLNSLENLDLSDVDPSVAEAGLTPHGLGGVTAAINTFAVLANEDLFAQAGVSLPDDSTWDWEDYIELAAQITDADIGAVGLQYLSFNDGDLRTWARQHAGEEFFDADGNIEISAQTLTQWWELVLEASERGATPSTDRAVEWAQGTQDQHGISVNAAAMASYWSNQVISIEEASGSPIALLRQPGNEGAQISGQWYKPSMFWSISAHTEYPEAAATFVDYLINSPEAAEILLVERGIPVSSKMQEHIVDFVSEEDGRIIEFIDDVADIVGPPPPLTPPGGENMEETLKMYTTEVLFGSKTPAEAAEAFLGEVQTELDLANR